MRPIEKGAFPAQYVYNIQVTPNNQLETSLNTARPHIFPRSPAVRALYNKATLTPLESLGAVLLLRAGFLPLLLNVANPPTQQQIELALPALGGYAERIYQSAAALLGDRLGKFCCYCDQPLAGQIAVEHVLPKSYYPLFTIAWENFLLACEICNSNKLNQPSRAEMDAWPGNPPFGHEEAVRYTTMRAHYLWPDVSNNVYTNYRPQLFKKQGNNWTQVQANEALGGRITQSVLSTRMVRAWLPGLPVQQDVEVQARMVPQGLPAEASHTLLGLQKDGTEQAGKISDTRMFNRTLAWFRVQKLLGPAIRAATAGEPSFGERWEAVLAAAPAIGYFPVWIRLLELYNASQVNVPGAQPPTNVGDYFLQQTNANGIFPNTRLGGL